MDLWLDVCVLSCSVMSPHCDPTNYSPPEAFVHGIFQARILEWVLLFPIPGDLPDPDIEPGLNLHLSHFLHRQAAFLPLLHLGRPVVV